MSFKSSLDSLDLNKVALVCKVPEDYNPEKQKEYQISGTGTLKVVKEGKVVVRNFQSYTKALFKSLEVTSQFSDENVRAAGAKSQAVKVANAFISVVSFFALLGFALARDIVFGAWHYTLGRFTGNTGTINETLKEIFGAAHSLVKPDFDIVRASVERIKAAADQHETEMRRTVLNVNPLDAKLNLQKAINEEAARLKLFIDQSSLGKDFLGVQDQVLRPVISGLINELQGKHLYKGKEGNSGTALFTRAIILGLEDGEEGKDQISGGLNGLKHFFPEVITDDLYDSLTDDLTVHQSHNLRTPFGGTQAPLNEYINALGDMAKPTRSSEIEVHPHVVDCVNSLVDLVEKAEEEETSRLVASMVDMAQDSNNINRAQSLHALDTVLEGLLLDKRRFETVEALQNQALEVSSSLQKALEQQELLIEVYRAAVADAGDLLISDSIMRRIPQGKSLYKTESLQKKSQKNIPKLIDQDQLKITKVDKAWSNIEAVSQEIDALYDQRSNLIQESTDLFRSIYTNNFVDAISKSVRVSASEWRRVGEFETMREQTGNIINRALRNFEILSQSQKEDDLIFANNNKVIADTFIHPISTLAPRDFFNTPVNENSPTSPAVVEEQQDELSDEEIAQQRVNGLLDNAFPVREEDPQTVSQPASPQGSPRGMRLLARRRSF